MSDTADLITGTSNWNMREELEPITGTHNWNSSQKLHIKALLTAAVCTGYLLLVTVPVAFAGNMPAIQVFKTPDSNLNFMSFADRLGGVANKIIPFLIGVALVAIIWGIFKYIQSAGDTEKVAEGRKVIVYGILALFMMLSFWGFVMIIKNTLFG